MMEILGAVLVLAAFGGAVYFIIQKKKGGFSGSGSTKRETPNQRR